MDSRIRFYLERELGCSLQAFPSGGIEIRESSKRTDELHNRMRIIRIGNAALATGIHRVTKTITSAIQTMSIWELFSPVGTSELERALQPEKVEEGFGYTLADEQDFHPQDSAHRPVRLASLSDEPPNEAELRVSPQHLPPNQDYILAFAIYHHDEQVARSGIRWQAPGLVEIGVDTTKEYRGRGYGLATVEAATRWILRQGAVALYRVDPTNTPSVRIARRLGFRLTFQELGA